MNDLDMPVNEMKESIKLLKMSKGYNWEIKLFPAEMNDKEWLARLEELNNEIIKRFGSLMDNWVGKENA